MGSRLNESKPNKVSRVVRFSKQEFEDALPKHKTTGDKLWKHLGLLDGMGRPDVAGEETYEVQFGSSLCKIVVRSSVKNDGIAASNGKDSIRIWLVDNEGRPLANKIQDYVCRTKNWATKMIDVMRETAMIGKKIKCCPQCGKAMGIRRVKKDGDNKGRLFMSCSVKTNDGYKNHCFEWID